MPAKKHITPNEKLPLKLTAAERTLVLEGLTCLDQAIEQVVRDTPAGKPIMMTLDDLEDFGGYIAAEANHCEDKRKAKKLDGIFEQIQALLDKFTDEEPPQTVKIEDARKTMVIADQAVRIAEWAAKALVAAEQLGIKNKPLEHFGLAPTQRDALLLVPGVTMTVKKKLARDGATFSIAEVASMTMALAEDLLNGDARKQVAVLLVAKHLIDLLKERIIGSAKPKSRKSKSPKVKSDPTAFFQFRIALKDSKPPIWRRIQVEDCTLDKLHEHIQTAMGWTNSHLHQFEITGKRYGDPVLLEETFEELGYEDSTRTTISEIIPSDRKRFRFHYEYDFGDGWGHEILFEGCPKKEPGRKYPVCLEGEGACPPEDVGGIGGFYEFLEALANPKHERHEEFLEWAGPFDPEKFDAQRATRAMKKGLPEWRE